MKVLRGYAHVKNIPDSQVARRDAEGRREVSRMAAYMPERHPVGDKGHYLALHGNDVWGIYSKFGLHCVASGKDKAEAKCCELIETGKITV